MSRRPKPKQFEMVFKSWGGARKGAGRPRIVRGGKGAVPHRQREALASRYPVHVTLRLLPAMRGLRNKARFAAVRRSFVRCCARMRFRITDFSVMGDHIHLIAEARDAQALGKGMQGFKVSVARGLNRVAGRKGTVFAERYHSRILRTPREVRNALAYVLNNARKHGYSIPTNLPDRYSSWAHFTGWRYLDRRRAHKAYPQPAGPPPVAPPKTWLRNTGWSEHHPLISINKHPGPSFCA